MTNIPVWSGEEILVKKLGVNALLLLCRLRLSKSFQSDNYCDLNNSTLVFFYLVLSKSFSNSVIALVVIVRFLYDVIHQVDYSIGQNRQIQANSDCEGHNGTDTNRPVCVQVCILSTF